ncbi:MAG: hypothetical protein KBF88_15285 [Polyangiaceae bacterium]|nr:hypothetical protein [Polyangiaceae bacterium]
MRTFAVLSLLGLLSAFSSVGCSAEQVGGEEEPSDLEESYGELSLPEPTGNAAQYPIVLAHGFNGSPSNQWGYYKVADALRKDGHKVFEAAVAPYNSADVRAIDLKKVVDQALQSASKVNIVAHSMGGLDARVLISKLGYGDRVASLTTISTPHQGTLIGDVALKLVKDGPISNALNTVAAAWGRTFTEDELANNTAVRGALLSIAERSAEEFNARNKDDARVYYQSWAGVSARLGIGDSDDKRACDGKLEGSTDVMDVSLRAGSIVVSHRFGFQGSFKPNDGMVTVESAKHGHFRGCLRADHLDEVGQPKHDKPNRRTQFDHLHFFRTLAFELADKRF